jgi:hypothetical protein
MFGRLMVETIADIQDPLEDYEKSENRDALMEAEEARDSMLQEIEELKRQKSMLQSSNKLEEAGQYEKDIQQLEVISHFFHLS